MGGEASTLGGPLQLQWAQQGEPAEQMNSNAFVGELKKACTGGTGGAGDLQTYRDLWRQVEAARRAQHPKYDQDLISDNVMRWVKFAFRQYDTEWRIVGIYVARTFFHLKDGREKLVSVDFLTSLLLITLPDAMEEDDDDQDEHENKARQEKEKKEEELQLLAAETLCEMADHAEFMSSLCSTPVLNFLCIVLNQLPAAMEIVTHTFVKLSDCEENLVILMEGSVGQILESFFKTVNYKRPVDDDEKQLEFWDMQVSALGHCAHTLGTLIQYNHQCQVHTPTIIQIFSSIDRGQAPSKHITRLVAETTRLLYWICRRSKDIKETLREAASGSAEPGADFILHNLKVMWDKCIEVQADAKVHRRDPAEFGGAINYPQMHTCYMNCIWWVLLPMTNLRWKLKDLGLKKLHLAFELREESFLLVILGTVRHLVDQPHAQECNDLIRFFGEQLLILLDLALKGEIAQKVTRLLLDTISILAMQRGMQETLAEYDIYGKLSALSQMSVSGLDPEELKKKDLAVLRTLAEVATHPSHRLSWVGSSKEYPPRTGDYGFAKQLERRIKSSDENSKTIASLLLTLFQEHKFKKNDLADIEDTFKSVLDWWKVNTTGRYVEEKEASEEREVGSVEQSSERARRTPLWELLERSVRWKQEGRALTSMETLPYCAPHECVLALSLLSRLALEPKFKRLFDDEALEALLGCVCVGIWVEAREAAATLANLMWIPDLKEERLVCWLKFDGPRCITLDAANVLVPVKEGNPKPADIGKGMYESSWGIEFIEGTCVTLHPDGLHTCQIPGILTSASPLDTFAQTSRRPYSWLDDEPNPRHFTITCWFYWPLNSTDANKVLVQSSPPSRSSQIYLDCENDLEGVWTMVDEKSVKRPMKTPRLNPGWHMLSLVSSTKGCRANPFDGTKFFLDDWHCLLKHVWVKNDFYMVGNDSGHGGRSPFGLICDFRIYARTLRDDEIEKVVHERDMASHPDKLVRRLAQMDAATILAQRLDVPDSAAECLRALGSLATLCSQRAKIYSVCGRRVLKMLDSPFPLIQRQASRLLCNLT